MNNSQMKRAKIEMHLLVCSHHSIQSCQLMLDVDQGLFLQQQQSMESLSQLRVH